MLLWCYEQEAPPELRQLYDRVGVTNGQLLRSFDSLTMYCSVRNRKLLRTFDTYDVAAVLQTGSFSGAVIMRRC
jgi:hypothetical protein